MTTIHEHQMRQFTKVLEEKDPKLKKAKVARTELIEQARQGNLAAQIEIKTRWGVCGLYNGEEIIRW